MSTENVWYVEVKVTKKEWREISGETFGVAFEKLELGVGEKVTRRVARPNQKWHRNRYTHGGKDE